MSILSSEILIKLAWIALIPASIFVIIFGIAGIVVANMNHLPAFIPVAYSMILGGFGIIGLSIYKLARVRAKERVYARDYVTTGEQILEEWRYRVWIGFLRWQKVLVVLTNQRLIAINQGTRHQFFEGKLTELFAVAKNRRTISHFSHSFVHLETQRGNSGPGLGIGSSAGTSSGIARVVGDIDLFVGGKLVYWMIGVNDPDGVVETIRVIQKSATVA
jgi:hypothetical protein